MLLTSCVSLEAAQLEVQIHQSPLDVRHAFQGVHQSPLDVRHVFQGVFQGVHQSPLDVRHVFQGVFQGVHLCLTSCFMNKINKSACMCDTCLQLHHGRHDLIVLTASSFLLVLRFHCFHFSCPSSSSSSFLMNHFRCLNAQSP